MFRELFYDIEAFVNLFTISIYCPQTNTEDVYYLCDNPLLVQNGAYIDAESCAKRIREVNPVLNTADIRFFNLHSADNASRLASETIKLPVCGYPMFLYETDQGYSKENGSRLFGYNSVNYDLVMLAWYFANVFKPVHNSNVFVDDVTANMMYQFNNTLFTMFHECMPKALGYHTREKSLYYNMLQSGRHIDVSGLNEKQSKVPLKRLCGTLGLQIKESDLLNEGNTQLIDTTELFNEAVAYNISDTVNLEFLFRHKLYKSTYELKNGLLITYPELIYDKEPNRYCPAIKPDAVRYDRLRADSTSAAFATRCLFPYSRAEDYETVSFMYPSPELAETLGIKPFNVLDDLMDWYESQFRAFPDVVTAFRVNIYNYYKSIEGKNFNGGKNYQSDYGDVPCYDLKTLRPVTDQSAPVSIFRNYVDYLDVNGQPTGCYVQFSIGGLHGAEYNLEKYQNDIQCADLEQQLLNRVKALYPNPYDLRVAKSVTIDGTEYSYTAFLKSGATLKDPESCVYRTISRPALFKLKDGSYSLNERYTYTSSSLCDHEDFRSYYPMLLINLCAMHNKELGYDRYREIYDQKEEFGAKTKDISISTEDAKRFELLRAGTKLILNSATGAGDLSYDTPVRMNNRIISMRIIGQLLTFRIAQEQTLAGARVLSTNTDGIYVATSDKVRTRAILKRLEDQIHIEIEPEEMYLISKDTNNRLELSPDRTKILSASGGSLSCYELPSPAHALDHPAIIDNALVTWLQRYGSNLSVAPTVAQMRQFLETFIQYYDRERVLMMFQTIISSSPASSRFITLVHGEHEVTDISVSDCMTLQRFNRVFYVRAEYSDDHLYLVTQRAASKNQPANEEDASEMLRRYGTKKHPGYMASFGKVPGINPASTVRIYNKPIVNCSDTKELDTLIQQLDLDVYAELICKKFTDCWLNA